MATIERLSQAGISAPSLPVLHWLAGEGVRSPIPLSIRGYKLCFHLAWLAAQAETLG